MRSWHVIVAEPGSGKTMGIGDLRDAAARQAGMVGGRRYPVLAVTAPKNDPREAALGNLLLLALGVGSRGRWNERKYLLYDLFVNAILRVVHPNIGGRVSARSFVIYS